MKEPQFGEQDDALKQQQLTAAAEDSILDCLDRAMQILGNSGMYAVYHVMKSEYHMAREEIPANPNGFINVLEEIFGLGCRVLEERILEELRLLKNIGIETDKMVRFFASVLDADLNAHAAEVRKA